MKIKLCLSILIVFITATTSCKKSWLEKKRDLSLIVPSSLKDARLLLNNGFPLNYDARGITEVSCDDYYMIPSMYDGLFLQSERNAYTWETDIFASELNIDEWDASYQSVLYANVILEALKAIEVNKNNKVEFDEIMGGALYYRSRAFLNLAMTFANYYDSTTASSDQGIPLKMTPDINEPIKRATLKEVYDRITQDLIIASELLPNNVTTNSDPSKASAYSLLARCYLFMDKYDLALIAANSSYNVKNALIDFNTLNAGTDRPITFDNIEIISQSQIMRSYNTFVNSSYIDTTLYRSYNDNDLRKTIYFMMQPDGGIRYRGSYIGTGNLFGGTATDEVLLIRAECKARLNDVSGAMSDLNTLLIKRFRTGTFIPYSANNSTDALVIILNERRKELTRRGLRWQDLKRLNRDPRFSKTLVRNLKGDTFTLLPNDPKYIMPIPNYVIEQNGITQNFR